MVILEVLDYFDSRTSKYVNCKTVIWLNLIPYMVALSKIILPQKRLWKFQVHEKHTFIPLSSFTSNDLHDKHHG